MRKMFVVLLVVVAMVSVLGQIVLAADVRYEVSAKGELQAYKGNTEVVKYTWFQWDPSGRASVLGSKAKVSYGPEKISKNEIEFAGTFEGLEYQQYFELSDDVVYSSAVFTNETEQVVKTSGFAHGLIIPVELFKGTVVQFAGFEVVLEDVLDFRWRDNSTANWCYEMVVGKGSEYEFLWKSHQAGMITIVRQGDYYWIYAMIAGDIDVGRMMARDVQLSMSN